MAENDADRTEPATPKRREDARKKGDVAKSREISATVLMAVGFLAIASSLGGAVARGVMARSRDLLSGAVLRPGSLADYHAILLHEIGGIALLLLPIALLLLVAGLAGGLAQVGLMFSWKAVSPQVRRINPLSGLKRMVSPDQLFELGKSMLKVALIFGLAAAVIVPATCSSSTSPKLDRASIRSAVTARSTRSPELLSASTDSASTSSIVTSPKLVAAETSPPRAFRITIRPEPLAASVRPVMSLRRTAP